MKLDSYETEAFRREHIAATSGIADAWVDATYGLRNVPTETLHLALMIRARESGQCCKVSYE